MFLFFGHTSSQASRVDAVVAIAIAVAPARMNFIISDTVAHFLYRMILIRSSSILCLTLQTLPEKH
jgi:hypothetical protein